MLKLVLCLLFGLLLCVVVLQLRQQRLELNHQANDLHNQIEAQQAKLWNQQLQIAVVTAPNAIAQTVNNKDLNLVPRPRIDGTGVRPVGWSDSGNNADAE